MQPSPSDALVPPSIALLGAALTAHNTIFKNISINEVQVLIQCHLRK